MGFTVGALISKVGFLQKGLGLRVGVTISITIRRLDSSNRFGGYSIL